MDDNDNLTNDMMDRIAKMLRDDLKRPKDTVFVNPAWKGEIEKATRGTPYQRTGQLFGMNVVYSPYVETGKVYMADRPKSTPPPLDFDFKEIEQAFLKHISAAFGIPPRYFEQPERPYNWKRLSDETLLTWGERLADKGLLDNPEIRWEYQKAILGAPFAKLKAVWVRFR